jgi:hypothetical protein
MISLNDKFYKWNSFNMASAADFCEDNGAAAGSPAKGTSRTFRRTECNWKNIDDSTTAYSSSPITTGNNSYEKWQFLAITGTFNQLSAGLWGHTTGIFGAGLKLVTVVTSGYHSPVTTTLSSGIDITQPSGLAAASQTVFFSQIGPEAGSHSGTSTMISGYTEYLVTQLITTTSASPGDTSVATLTFQMTEN